MEMSAQTLRQKLKELQHLRFSGGISEERFYQELLALAAKLLQELTVELTEGHIGKRDIKRQMPLILAVLTGQIDLLEKRERDRGKVDQPT